MGESLKIIRFNDDNHAERIWINGRFVGTTANLDEVFEEFLKISQEKTWFRTESTTIWTCDDFEEFEEDKEWMIDKIWDWFNVVEIMIPSQILAIQSKNWELLLDLII